MKAKDYTGADPIKVESFTEHNIALIAGTITAITEKQFDYGKPRPVITLGDDEWTLTLNQTNVRTLWKGYGTDNMDAWIGRPVECYVGKVKYNGAEQESVCVRVPEAAAAPAEKPAATVTPLPKRDGDFEDDIPF